MPLDDERIFADFMANLVNDDDITLNSDESLEVHSYIWQILLLFIYK